MASADLKAELECPICLEIYTDPVTLRCGHNFCRTCIGCVLDTQDGSRKYSCPECREEFENRPALQKNIKLRNIVENFLSAQQDQKQPGVFCTYCVDSPVAAVKSCLLCEASLCDKHLKVHSESPEHVLCDPTTSLKNRKCSIHKETFKYYCTEDSTCICVSCCLIGDHRGHQMVSLDEASNNEKTKLRYALPKLLTEREEAEERTRRLLKRQRRVEENAAEETEKITAMFKDLRKQLEDLEKKVLSEISGQTESILSNLSHRIKEIETEKTVLCTKMRQIEELCNMMDPVAVLQKLGTGDLWGAEHGGDQDTDRPDTCLDDGGDQDTDRPDTFFDDGEDQDTERPDTFFEDGGDQDTARPDTFFYDGEDQDTERPDTFFHDGGDQDVFPISHTLHTLFDMITAFKKGINIKASADIILDVDTAHKRLQISDDRKDASRSTKQKVTDTPKRFKDYAQVMSRQSFSSGQLYWEVDVGRSHSWIIGMCYSSMDRIGQESQIGYNKKSWGLERVNDTYSLMHDGSEFTLPNNIFIRKVRIYLDYEAGQISFYSLCHPICHLYTFTTTFTEPLHAVIGMWDHDFCFGRLRSERIRVI